MAVKSKPLRFPQQLSQEYSPAVRRAILAGMKQGLPPDEVAEAARIAGGMLKFMAGFIIGLSGSLK